MGLTLPNAQYLLRQIVGGGQGFNTNVGDRYLALSTTKPNPNPASGQSYNVTEPSGTGYARVSLNATNFTNEATGETIGDVTTYTISNTVEIHFPEAITAWNNEQSINYFAIYSTRQATTAPIYVGELFSYNITTVTAETFDAMVAAGLYTFDTATSTYIQVTSGDVYNPSTIYYTRTSGVVVKAGTVPLIRTGFLKISVQ